MNSMLRSQEGDNVFVAFVLNIIYTFAVKAVIIGLSATIEAITIANIRAIGTKPSMSAMRWIHICCSS